MRPISLKKTTYRRKSWTDKKIDEGIRKGKIIVRTKDVGKKNGHYIHMYYLKRKGQPNKLIKATYRKYK